MVKKIILSVLLGFAATATYSQQPSAVVQPGYFLFPIRPGQANSLAGGFGDLRPNHFHAGLDIRTGGREGADVLAAADGYVSRIAVMTSGYGNVVFIKHPNGLTTVYGHLRNLNDSLGRYLKQQQYDRETFEIDLRPAPHQFPVRQGEFIAASGNTGGSGGPHLHFEVRDANDNLINPLLYEFSEISDNIPPYFERIALKTMTAGSRLNGEYQRIVRKPIRQPDGTYRLTEPVSASGLIGVEVLAYDKSNGSPYRQGISCLELVLDGREVFTYKMRQYPNAETHDMNVHENFEVEQVAGQRFHRAYLADGNTLPLYHLPQPNPYNGRLLLMDKKPHEVRITIYDIHEQSATLVFTLLPDGVTAPPDPTDDSAEADTDDIMPEPIVGVSRPLSQTAATLTTDENLLKISLPYLSSQPAPVAKLMTGQTAADLPVSYTTAGQLVYLIDLRQAFPDSILFDNQVIRTYFQKRVVPGRAADISTGSLAIRIGEQTLYDTLYVSARLVGSNGFEINQAIIPLKTPIQVRFKPQPSFPVDTLRTRLYQVSGSKPQWVGGRWQNGQLTAQTAMLGKFQLLTDNLPPTIQILSANAGGIRAIIRDDLSGIAAFRALVNGEWVLMQYDYKKALLWSDKLDPAQPFEMGDEVVIQVKDLAGNIATDRTFINTAVKTRTIIRRTTTQKTTTTRTRKRKR